MHKKKIAAMTMAIIISNFSATTLEVLADEISNNTSVLEINDNKEVTKAAVNKFDLYNSDKLNDYNSIFKIDNSKIKSSPSSVRDEYISNSCANPFPFAPSCLAAYTILFKSVVSLNVNTTSFVNSELFCFPVSQWVFRLLSIALSIDESLYCPPS